MILKRWHRRPQNSLTQLGRAIGWFGSYEAQAPTPGEIGGRLVAVADAEKWAASTFNHHLNVISLAYRLALRAGAVTTNPARLVQRRNDGKIREGSFPTLNTPLSVRRASQRSGSARCWRWAHLWLARWRTDWPPLFPCGYSSANSAT